MALLHPATFLRIMQRRRAVLLVAQGAMPMALVLPEALSPQIDHLLTNHAGIFLDVACGRNKSKGAIGMDIRALPEVDIVWDMEETPWPLPDACVTRMLLSHIVEHLKPWRTFPVFAEIHRVLKPAGQVSIATPYPGPRFWQDPTHVHAWNETTCRYWDPAHPSGLWYVYEPSPFTIDLCQWDEHGDLHIVMTKLAREVLDQERAV